MKDIFISFSSKDSDKAMQTCEFLERNGFSCFISTRDLIAGRDYASQLFDNIDASRMVLLILSENANNSPHVLREIEYAVRKKYPVLVYSIEKVTLSKSMEYYLMTHQWVTPQLNADAKLLEGVSETLNKDKPAKIKKDAKAFPVLLVIACLMLIILIVVAIIPATSSNKEPPTSAVAQATEEQTAAQTTTVAPTTQAPQETTTPSKEYELGDTVTFGRYLGEDITWRVIRIEDGNLTLIAQDILTMKSYDAPEGGEYNFYDGVNYFSSANADIKDPNLQILVRGNNDWEKSNIRLWLNSSEEMVNYPDQSPTYKAVGDNHYEGEKGFLYDFTMEEMNALVPVQITTPGNELSSSANGLLTTIDYVYLLASDELNLLYDAGMTRFAKPSATCIAQNGYASSYQSQINDNKTETYYWLLRDNSRENCYRVYFVTSEYEEDLTISQVSAGVSTYGIRPVITVKAEGIE